MTEAIILRRRRSVKNKDDVTLNNHPKQTLLR